MEILVIADLSACLMESAILGLDRLPQAPSSSNVIKQGFPELQESSPARCISRRERLLSGYLIVTSTPLSLLSVRSAAFSVIQIPRETWSAGTASIRPHEHEASFWPTRLPADSIDGSHRDSPYLAGLTHEALNEYLNMNLGWLFLHCRHLSTGILQSCFTPHC